MNFEKYLQGAGIADGLTEILTSIASSAELAAIEVRNAPLSSKYGAAGSENVQGEQVQKLDIVADNIFSDSLLKVSSVAGIVSEERETFTKGNSSNGTQYLVSHDPLDGSSNIDVNVAIGTIFAVQNLKDAEVSEKSFLNTGENLVAAGYVMYGASTILVVSVGKGVCFFSYSESEKCFELVEQNVTIPETGKIYSCNQGNSAKWSPGVRQFLEIEEKRGSSLRYVGSLVADFHRTMLKGGVFLYPNDAKNLHGKLRLLYECVPMAYLAEQAGGAASNGSMRVLEVHPDGIHQRIPFYIGSKDLVEQIETCIAEQG